MSSRIALLSIPNISNCCDYRMGKRALTFPVDLTPFQMQKKHITQTRRRHSARSHLIIPISSIPEDKLSTLRLNIWKETKRERCSSSVDADSGCDGWEYMVVCRAAATQTDLCSHWLAKSVAYVTKAVLCNPTSPLCLWDSLIQYTAQHIKNLSSF